MSIYIDFLISQYTKYVDQSTLRNIYIFNEEIFIQQKATGELKCHLFKG